MPVRLDHLVLITISLASAILGVAVFSRAPDRVWNRLFAVQAFAVSVWVLLNYLIQVAATRQEADLWLRLTHPTVALVICTCVDLFWVFPERNELAPRAQRVALYGMGLVFSLAGIAPNLYRSLELAQGTVLVQYDWPFLAFGVFTMGTLGYADYMLFRKRPRLLGLQRAQVNYVLTGMIIGQTIALVTMVLLPLIWGNTYYSRWGSASYIFVVGFMAYAIAKHGIIRPAAALSRVSGYLITGVLLGLPVLLVIFLSRHLPGLLDQHHLRDVYLVLGICVGLLGFPLHNFIRQRLELALPGAGLVDAARSTSDAILRTLDGEQLPDFLCTAILQMLKATHVSVFARDPRSSVLLLRAQHAATPSGSHAQIPDRLSPASILLHTVTRTHDLLDRTQIRRFYSLVEAQPLLTAMRELDVEVVAPILWEDQLIGLVLIGERIAGDMYAPDELQALRNLLPQVSLAVRNAQLFDEVVRMKEYNENILRQMQSGVIAVNSDREIVTLNPSAEDLLGIRAQDVIGRSLEVLPDKIAARLALALSGHAIRREDRVEIENGQGERVPVACSTTRWRGAALSQEGAIAVLNDLTLVEELERERRDAEHLAMIRLLSAGMAHELRNPLVAIRTFAELLPTRWDDDEFRVSFLGTAQEEIERIDRLLTDLLMLSKPADAVVEATNVDEVCAGVVRTMSAKAEASRIRLETDLDFSSDRPFYGDRGRLHQALVNLVKNALEAEPEGGFVKVTTRSGRNAEEQAVARITIHNANSFIPEDRVEEIFRPFCSQRQGGTGLGLSVCQTIIEEHEGLIKVRSAPDTGTDFIVELPVRSGSRESSYGRSLSQ